MKQRAHTVKWFEKPLPPSRYCRPVSPNPANPDPHLIFVPAMPHQTKDEQLAVVISSKLSHIMVARLNLNSPKNAHCDDIHTERLQ